MSLNRSQRAIAKRVLELVHDDGFVLVGGLALLELGVTTRPTEDLDASSDRARAVGTMAERVAGALRNGGLSVSIDRSSDSFARFVVTTGRYRQSVLKVELGFDTLLFPAVDSALGAHQPRELSDIYDLASLLPVVQMLDDAGEKDHGFNRGILAEMIVRTVRSPDELWPPTTDVRSVQTFITQLAEGLRNGTRLPSVPPRESHIDPYRRTDGTVVRGYRRPR